MEKFNRDNIDNELNLIDVESIDDIPSDEYLVYILTSNEKAIIVGHGKKNRAKVIFDNGKDLITKSHIKSLMIRVLMTYGNETYKRYIIRCHSKHDALKIENHIHKTFGGNSIKIPQHITEKLFTGLSNEAKLLLQIALLSSFSGIADLMRWKKSGSIISNSVWQEIEKKLNL